MRGTLVGIVILCGLADGALAQQRPTTSVDAKAGRHAPKSTVIEESPVVVFGDSILNISDHDIIAMAGVATHMSPWGPQTSTWDASWGGILLGCDISFKAGTSIVLHSVPDPSGRQHGGGDYEVQGVVLADGSTWGAKGKALKAKLADRARAGRMHLRDLATHCQESDAEECVLRVVESRESFFAPPFQSLHRELRALLTDPETHQLVANPLHVLQREIDRLGRF